MQLIEYQVLDRRTILFTVESRWFFFFLFGLLERFPLKNTSSLTVESKRIQIEMDALNTIEDYARKTVLDTETGMRLYSKRVI